MDVQGLRSKVLRPLFFNVCRKALRRDIVELLVMNEYFGREALKNPLVTDGFVRRHTFLRVPLEASLYKVDK